MNNNEINDLESNLKNLIEKAKFITDIDTVFKEIRSHPYDAGRTKYLNKLAEKLKLNKKDIQNDFKKYLAKSVNTKKVSKTTYTENERRHARIISQYPNLLDFVILQIGNAGYVGEIINILLLYLAFTSRLFDEAISVVVKGSSSTGKSALVKNVLKLFPDDTRMEFTSITTQSLFYLKDKSLSHKILVIFESHGAKNADYQIRSSLSEGELKLLVTIKNPDSGVYEAEEINIPAEGLSYAETTTSSKIHPENQTRMFDIYMDESPEQTQRVLLSKAKNYDHVQIKKDNRIFQALQSELKPYPVDIPYAEILAERFPVEKVRVRRDFPRFLLLIKASALLHQLQREIKTIGGKEHIVANIDDYLIAYIIGKHILTQTLKEISPRQENILEVIQNCFPEEEFALRDLKGIGEIKRYADSTLRADIKALSQVGYLDWNGEKGKKSSYKLMDTPKDFFGLPTPGELTRLGFGSSALYKNTKYIRALMQDEPALAEFSPNSPIGDEPVNEPNKAESNVSSNKPAIAQENVGSGYSAKAKKKYCDNFNQDEIKNHPDHCDCDKCTMAYRIYWWEKHGFDCNCESCNG